MIIPVRCFTCGAVVASKWDAFSTRVQAGEPVKKVLDDLNVERYCCRRMLLSHCDIIDEVSQYII